jgi:hypothetical protein
MGTLSIRWMAKVLLYAAVVAALVALNILWQPRTVQPLPQPITGPASVQQLLDQCRAGSSNISEVHHCDAGWAVFRFGLSPQVFDVSGNELCPAKDINDTSTSDCLRAVSDQVGRCTAACTAPTQHAQ